MKTRNGFLNTNQIYFITLYLWTKPVTQSNYTRGNSLRMSCQQRNVPNVFLTFYVLIILPMKKVMIECKRCWKLIEKKGTREYCIPCRNILDKKRIAERTQTPEYKQFQREKYLAKKRIDEFLAKKFAE